MRARIALRKYGRNVNEKSVSEEVLRIRSSDRSVVPLAVSQEEILEALCRGDEVSSSYPETTQCEELTT